MSKGFSLIELLLVMAIMAILSTLMLPNLLGAQDKARESGVRAVAHAIQLALESYYVDHGVYPSGSNLGVAELYEILEIEGQLTKKPKNPYTGRAYDAADAQGQVLYSLGSSGYSLKAYGRSLDKLIYEGGV